MSDVDDKAAFERRLVALLERDADTTSAHVRSRLTQARHAALAQAAQRSGWLRRGLVVRRVWMPAAGALVAALVWVMLLGPRRAAPAPPFTANAGALAAEDVSLLSDRDGLALVQDGDGQFYEWAAAQARLAPQTGAEAVESNENGG
jgi:hypothetical protein